MGCDLCALVPSVPAAITFRTSFINISEMFDVIIVVVLDRFYSHHVQTVSRPRKVWHTDIALSMQKAPNTEWTATNSCLGWSGYSSLFCKFVDTYIFTTQIVDTCTQRLCNSSRQQTQKGPHYTTPGWVEYTHRHSFS